MKKIISIITVLVLVVSLLAGCGGAGNSKKLTVAASATPHAEILEQCKAAMEEKGFTLEVKVMDDYITPNTSTESGDVDANFFQHTPYLDQFNEENSTHLVSVAKVHYEPYAIYAGKIDKIKKLKKGDKIAVPNDATNEARALMLLETNGIITLKEGAGLTATKNDIEKYNVAVEIVEMEAALIPGVLEEVALGVINGNYAIGAGLKVADSLAMEKADSEAGQTYANILVVKEGNEEKEAVKALCEILKSEEIKTYINNTYSGAVVPMN